MCAVSRLASASLKSNKAHMLDASQGSWTDCVCVSLHNMLASYPCFMHGIPDSDFHLATELSTFYKVPAVSIPF